MSDSCILIQSWPLALDPNLLNSPVSESQCEVVKRRVWCWDKDVNTRSLTSLSPPDQRSEQGNFSELSPGAVGAGGAGGAGGGGARAEHQAAINSMMMERMSTDIYALKKQYTRIKRRQQQQAMQLYIRTGQRRRREEGLHSLFIGFTLMFLGSSSSCVANGLNGFNG